MYLGQMRHSVYIIETPEEIKTVCPPSTSLFGLSIYLPVLTIVVLKQDILAFISSGQQPLLRHDSATIKAEAAMNGVD